MMQYQTPVSELTLGDLTNPFIIKALITEHKNSPPHNPTTFIDTGAMGNFIHPQLISKLGLTAQNCTNPL
jgi:hypothetical protein